MGPREGVEKRFWDAVPLIWFWQFENWASLKVEILTVSLKPCGKWNRQADNESAKGFGTRLMEVWNGWGDI
jgi:hypothetical protein